MSLPEPPTNVTVIPGITEATVSWTPSTSVVTGYKVFCMPDNKLPNLATANATSLVVTKLKNGVPCTFRVHAYNQAGMSAMSAPSVPGPPPAAPKIVALRGPGSGTIVLTLSGKPQKGSSLTYYNLSVSPEAPSAVIPTNVPAIPTNLPGAALTYGASATITGLTLGTVYTVSATVTGPTGTSLAAASKPVTAADVPGAPVITRVLVSTTTTPVVELAWTSPQMNGLPIIGYIISYRIGQGVPTILKAKVVNVLSIKGLLRGTTYTFSIQATNLKGNSEPSNIMTATTV
jgi:hypothetical protein